MTIHSVQAMLLAFAGGYALGAVPFGLLLARAFGRGDLRREGSGNIGATNALRVGGPWLGGATFLLDAGKGAVAVLAGQALFGPNAAWMAGAGAFLGHLYSVWLGMRGGKGVATMLGVTTAVMPVAGAVFAAVWIVVVACSRISSVGGMAAVVSAPVTAAVALRADATVFLFALALLVLFKHKANIYRLMSKQEPRLSLIRSPPRDSR